MHGVYAVGTEKRSLLEVLEPHKPKGGFFSSLVSAFTSQATPQSETAALPPQPTKDPTELHEMNVTLTVFTAEVDIKADKKLSAELLRATKKNPPARLEYDLIYVSALMCAGLHEGLSSFLQRPGNTSTIRVLQMTRTSQCHVEVYSRVCVRI